MVSAAKLRRAQENVMKARPYAEKVKDLVMELCQGMTAEDHPFFAPVQETKRLGIVVVTSDKGLCGSFNNNVVFRVEKELAQARSTAERVSLITVGKKGFEYFSKRRLEIRQKYVEDRERSTQELAAAIAGEARDLFLSGEWNEVRLYYTAFRSVVRNELTREQLLPISPSEHIQRLGARKDYLFEPTQKEILDRLLPAYLEVQIGKAMLESQTSEYAARMTAMDTASNNCRELITDLTLVYNKARQAAITKELLDIVGGAEALRK